MSRKFRRPPTREFTVYLGKFDAEATATVAMTHPGDPGRLSGPPEHCYPPEPAEFEIVNWVADGVPMVFLNGAATDAVLDMAREADWSDEPDADYLRDRQQDREMNGCDE